MDRNSSSGNELTPPIPRLGFSAALRRYFITGMATLFPVAVTLWLVWQIFLLGDQLLGDWIARLLGFRVPGLGLVAIFLSILSVGVFTVHFFGRVLFQAVEIALGRLPLFKKVYPVVKQFAQFLFEPEGRQTNVRGVVLVQYPRTGVYTMAFVTNESQTEVLGAPRTLVTLILPNPPSPFTGPLILVPKEDIIPLDLTVEDAVTFILSFGVVTPPLRAAKR